jgi:aminomethyltransferase
MRVSLLHDALSAHGARFSERCGIEVATSFFPEEQRRNEYDFVRTAAGVTDFSHCQSYTVPEETGIDFLDRIVAGNVAKIRFGRVLHTFIADTEGKICADCYVANNDEEFILVAESLIDDAALDSLLQRNGAESAGLKRCTESHVLIGIDGYRGWEIVKELFGVDVLGLPYLSIESYPFENEEIVLFRAGKTSEFGYLLMCPGAIAEKLFSECTRLAGQCDGGVCGVSIHNDLRLEGRFFNIYAEGARVGDPLTIGLQWMIDFDKEAFIGSDTLLKRRESGVDQKIIGVSSESSISVGMKIVDEADAVAQVVASCYSYILEKHIALALFPLSYAYAGLTFSLDDGGRSPVHTISMPPIMPKSLTVKLDEM